MPTVNLARERSLYRHFTEQSIQMRQSELAKLQEQLGTGRSVNRASDDPTSYGQARRLELLTNRYEQYDRAVTSARTWIDHTQVALDDLAGLFSDVYESGVKIRNSTYSADDRAAEARRLESKLAEIVDVLNSKSGEEYLFAGSRTTSRTGRQPFADDGTGTIVYDGDDVGRERQIGRDLRLDVNITGQELHVTGAGTTITDAVQNLIDAVNANDQAAMGTAIDEVTAARDHVLEKGAVAGTIANRLDTARAQMADLSLVAEGRRSEYEDTDFAEVAMAYQTAQNGLNASLRMAAEVLQTTILDYLR